MKTIYGQDILHMEMPKFKVNLDSPFIVRLHSISSEGFATHCGFGDADTGGLFAGALFKTREQAENYIETLPEDVRVDAFVTTLPYACLRKRHYYYMVDSDGHVTRKQTHHWSGIK